MRRIGFFKLSLIVLAIYLFLCLPSDAGLLFLSGGDKAPKFKFEHHFQENIDKLIAGSLESSIVWDRLAEMTDTFGNRLVGSDALEKSIDWIIGKVKGDGLSVTTEEVVVDYWERNEESLYFLSPTRGRVKLHMLGLGRSPATPVDKDGINHGITAEIIVVTSKEELEQLGAAGELKGRVVLYNKPFEAYSTDVIYRSMGATWAQEHGAVAVLVRSVAPLSLQTAHTGNAYPASIPAASISIEDAQLLARVLNRHQQDPKQFPDWPKVHLTMNAQTTLNSKKSRNIVVELKGRELPEEVVVVGGHIDSWDVGSGAIDDGAGCFIAWETVRQLSRLDKPPRRTVRAVFWTSEENGAAGGRVYAANHPETNTTRHVFAFESDYGVFDPYGINFTPGRRAQEGPHRFNSYEYLTAAGEHFLGSRKDLGYYGAGSFVLPNGIGADIAPLCKQGVACAQFRPADPFPLPYSTSPYYIKKNDVKSESRELGHRRHHHDGEDAQDPPRRPVDSGYFYYHHTEADTMGAFTPDQVKNSAAVMAVWTFIAAESRVEF
ncbi:hypothetical protein BCR41DRAFT_374859 [Lobosporangium transversale]|uniref:Peptide hydrolase n=1 Tax=Lobosporangium transversale TaxID=64571 RepID=A0A1Y2G8Z7_9FUNG|nr:hypothetical protein BCR41DRAFT_374859 [Lobosporangium transversale]ORZ04566.1 hypothetical protein BCR41DRAFT_374859 [Lobosporangium transversale]|eukprot:XP_021876612.1 hypothetical protein BCR41DRAFT_374859 [Lobosporangium transversale]